VERIFKILSYIAVFEALFILIGILFIMKNVMGETIGIGVSPSLLRLNSTGSYSYSFCFFNEGDTNAVYELMSGEVFVEYQRFVVPAGTNLTNCVRRTVNFSVSKAGYFYVVAKPEGVEEEAGAVSIIRRVGVKIELASQTTTTTTIRSGEGGGSGTYTTTTQTNRTTTTTTTPNKTTTTTPNKTTDTTISEDVEKIIEILNSTREEQSTNINIVSIVLIILLIIAVVFASYYIIQVI